MGKTPNQLNADIAESLSRGNAALDRATTRYYIRVKTAPHSQWMAPSGWSWAALAEAKRGARRADAQWMAVELVDGETGKKVRYK